MITIVCVKRWHSTSAPTFAGLFGDIQIGPETRDDAKVGDRRRVTPAEATRLCATGHWAVELF